MNQPDDNRLAVHGGKPIRAVRIPYGRQYIDQSDIDAVVEVLQGDYLTTGPYVSAFERDLTAVCGAKHAVAISNGTAALHAACFAAGIKTDDEVITTPITFAASANCVLYCGGTPVFADIDSLTWNIDPKQIKKMITPKTKAVIAVDFTGQATELKEIKAICQHHNLVFIEDAAHAIGTRYQGRPIGSIADMTTFSFHPVKTITTGEGGAITCNDEKLYQRLLAFRTHGIIREPGIMQASDPGPWFYEQQELGYNYRMTDIQAALGSSQLKKLPSFIKRRQEIVQRYNEAFSGLEAITLQHEIPESDTARHLYILRLNLKQLNADRQAVFEALAAENIGLQVHYIPVYYHPYYQRLGYKKGICPNAEALYKEIITIPLFYSMTDDDVESVISGVKKVIEYYSKA